MFGALRIERDRLDDEQVRLYRAHFCAACHGTREEFGRLESLGTNFEQTVLCMVLAGISEVTATESMGCTAWPLRKVEVVRLPGALRTYLAALNLAVIEQKLIDDQQDEGRWWTGALHRLLGRRFCAGRRRLSELGFPLDVVAGLATAQSSVEAQAGQDLAAYAAPSADLSAEVFGFGAVLAGRPGLAADLAELGATLGFLVYALDAWDDLESDRRRGRFNPLTQRSENLHSLRGQLDAALDRLDRWLDRLPLGPQGGILVALAASLRHRVIHRLPDLRAQAGDCDVCAAVECCSVDAGACEACACCDCCFFGEARSRRRERRRSRRSGAGSGP